ncbi:MAG TPA: PRTRC system protein B [Bryobacteraceae bacterium]|jgi:PRTRC genetic system protein B|nr:PRTRC system protein B [Bryobacterales bacterium]HRJ17405.1 PRTRC system protein B [Bryobacteraceae bacterium]
MKSYVAIGGSEPLSLKGALLFYEGRGRAFVTWHEAKPSPHDGIILGEAHELTTEFLRRLAQGLGTETSAEVLPLNMLAWTGDLSVWWTPRAVRRMYFRPNSEAPTGLSGEMFSQPPLVWKVAGAELSVRALRKNQRPSADTPLMIAPYWNTDGDSGVVCQGSMRAPEVGGIASLAAWEQAFFQSEFTHQTGVKKLLAAKRGYCQTLEALKGGHQRFRTGSLRPAGETLAEFIRRDR